MKIDPLFTDPSTKSPVVSPQQRAEAEEQAALDFRERLTAALERATREWLAGGAADPHADVVPVADLVEAVLCVLAERT